MEFLKCKKEWLTKAFEPGQFAQPAASILRAGCWPRQLFWQQQNKAAYSWPRAQERAFRKEQAPTARLVLLSLRSGESLGAGNVGRNKLHKLL